ncbi:MAG: hypothetical protein WAN51_00850 [Alphaproteobacteria bacterium]
MGTVVVGEIYPGSDRIQPPDPTEPEGCPGNPQQLSSYSFAYYSDDRTPDGKSPDAQPRPQLMRLFRTLRGDARPSPDDPQRPGELAQQGAAKKRCEVGTIGEEPSIGMTVCRIKPNSERHVADWTASYLTFPNVYTPPLGKPFVVNCDGDSFTLAIDGCDVTYTIAPGLGIAYEFQPYRGTDAIPIEHIIEFDRNLRAQIEADRLKEYKRPVPAH